jgi:RHS repeat-associated protein
MRASVDERDRNVLQRLTGTSRALQNGLTDPAPQADAYKYDDLGNISSKSDYGQVYVYGNQACSTNNAGSHAVATVSNNGTVKTTFSYDANGNLIQGDGRTIVFDNLDRPRQVVDATYATQFRCAPDGDRYVQSAKSTDTINEYYLGKTYERSEGGELPIDRTYVSGPVMIVREGPVREVRYRHLDRLGSLDAITDTAALEDVADAHGYDASGKPRARDWQTSGDQMQPGAKQYTTERGFTGHEHLDDLFLIHMNGRMYDYRLGRFLSIDPFTAGPLGSQAINPYSYIGSNPLSGVDPTGYSESANTPPQTCEGVANGKCTPPVSAMEAPTGSHVVGRSSDSVAGLTVNLVNPNYVEVRNGNEISFVPIVPANYVQLNGGEQQTAVPNSASEAGTGGPASTGQKTEDQGQNGTVVHLALEGANHDGADDQGAAYSHWAFSVGHSLTAG